MTPDEQRDLLALARSAMEARVRLQPEPEPAPFVASGTQPGAFVTILRDGELRGCLGRLVTNLPLAELVRQLALAVADADPRFAPVRPDELQRITLEISVLTPECEIRSIDEIEIGRHGLTVEQGGRRGLLLPQVALEHAWDVETFLSRTCVKAGLAPDAWRHGATVSVFEAEVFGEGEL